MRTPEQKAQARKTIKQWQARHLRIDYYLCPDALAVIEAERGDDGESCYSYSDVLDDIVKSWKALMSSWDD